MTETSVTSLLSIDQAAEELRRLAGKVGGTEFVRVRNLDYVVSPYELYPLPPHMRPPLERIAAFAVDMDGTSTTTEPLSVHALEYMVRRFTGLLTPQQWAGLDKKLDYPFIVGNSNLRHTEHLVERYRDRLNVAALGQAFIEAVCWTLSCMEDGQRRRDVTLNARNCGLGAMLEDAEFQRLVQSGSVTAENVERLVEPWVARFGPAFGCNHAGAITATALDIYYFRYHTILRAIEHGRGAELARRLLGEGEKRLIEPMPGYEVFLPLIKGWLGGEIDGLYELLRAELLHHSTSPLTPAELDAARPRLVRLAEHFRRQPAKIALVTASISYEAHASMKEVIAVTAERVRGWPIAAEHRERVAAGLRDYLAVFDGFVNASGTCEHRLKPHRDLYSLALQQMSIAKEDYRYCVGLEDSEPGIVALRTAGIGCAVALPNRETAAQSYAAATMIVRGGLPELILRHNMLLRDE
jgi:beta-phosphoglucomutase-like phosphatase (HAD superfamily)